MDVNDLIQAYSKEPINNYVMEDFTVSAEQRNTLCGDYLTIYLKIEEDIITEFSYVGSPAIFTLAAASMLAEEIEGVHVEKVANRDITHMEGLGLVVSPRRRRSTVTALLAVRNALHIWKDDGVVETYEDIGIE